MQMHKPWLLRSPPSTILRLILPLVIIISSPPSPVFFSGADQYSDCAPQEYACGILLFNLSYPFYINSGGLDYCGYPGFNLTCTGGILTIDININNKSPFVVKDINSSENLLAVVQPEIFNDNCNHLSLDNVTFDTTRFDYYPDYNDQVILFISCTATFSMMNPIGGCFENSYYWTNQSGSSPPNWSSLESSCRVVETWVNRTALRLLEEPASSVTFWNLLQDGFALKWTAGKELCGDCTKSSGRCGFNFTTNSELCFCEDGSAGERPYDPLVISVLNGSNLRLLLEDEDDFAMLAENIFIDLDKDDTGKLSKKEIQNALGHMGVEMGVPPFSECSNLLDGILTKHEAKGDHQLGQAQFAQLLQLVLQDLADALSEKHVTVICNVMVTNGSKIKKILGHEQLFHDEVRRMFQDWIASSHGKSKKDVLQGCLSAKSQELGLPPTDSNEAVELYSKIFSEVNEEVLAGDLTEEAFKAVVKDVMEKLVEQLDANPIFINIES